MNLRLLIVKHKQIVFLLFLIVVLVNYLKILLFVNDSSLKKCSYDYNNEQEDKSSNQNESLISFPSSLKVHSHLKHLNPIYLMPKFKLKYSKRFTSAPSLIIGISTVKRENSTYLITMLESLFRAMNNKEKDQVLVVLLIAEVKFVFFFFLFSIFYFNPILF